VSERRTWPVQIVAMVGMTGLVSLGIAATWPESIYVTARGPLDVRALVSAVGSTRVTEARMTGGFVYAPWSGAVRDTNQTESDGKWRRQLTANTIRARTEGRREPAFLHLRARAELVLQRSDEAIALLSDLAQQSPSNAEVLSDLSAAHLSRATTDARPDDLPRAIALAERSLALKPRLREALFNRALALEHLPLPTEAIKAWNDYLTIEKGTSWAHEALRRRNELRGRLPSQAPGRDRVALSRVLAACRSPDADDAVRQSTQATRELIEQELLPAWARATIAERHVEAAARLAAAHCGAAALVQVHSDALPAATIAALNNGSPATRLGVARGVVEYDEGRRLYENDRIAESQPLFRSAIDRLTREDNPFVWRATLDLGLTQFYERRVEEALATFDRVIRAGNAGRYLDLVGRAYWVRGLLRPMPASYDHRVADYRASQRAFEDAREWPSVAAVHVLLAETYQLYGDSRQAWHHRRLALAALPITTDPRRRHVLLLDGARASLQEALPETAAHFSTALLDAARAWQRDFAIAEAYRARAEARLKIGRVDEARADLREARRALSRVGDRGLTARLDPFLRTTLAEVQIDRDPALARTLADEAMTLQRDARYGHYLPRLWLLRARTFLSEHRPAEAAMALESGITEVEQQRVMLTDPETRRKYLDDCWDLYRAMVELQALILNRPQRGLVFAERGRARRFFDRREQRAAMDDENDLLRRWPSNTVGLVFVVLQDRTLVWILYGGRAEFRSLDAPRARLASLTRAYAELIAVGEDNAGLQALGSELYDLLLAPSASLIPDNATLVIVPDDVLVGVPFNALRPSGPLRPLGFNRAVTLAPSATAYLHLLHRADDGASTKTRSVSEALTITSSVTPAALPALPFAAREADALSRMYSRHTAVDAGRLPKSELLAVLSSHTIVHVALHAIAGSDRLEPYIVLGVSARDPDAAVISSREVERLSLERVRLVVLAGCSTARGVRSRAEGVMSLASSFLVAGVPTVLASLWDVEDRAAHAIVVRFHERLAKGMDAGRALSEAQRTMREDRDADLRRTKNWAGFVLLGAPGAVARP
jgi:CHAT domain-containing protein/tetratricopeptide (TPR) repeat protein